MCHLRSLRERLLHTLEDIREIEGSPFSKCKFDLYQLMLSWYSTTRCGRKDPFPNIRAEEWSGDASIVEGQER